MFLSEVVRRLQLWSLGFYVEKKDGCQVIRIIGYEVGLARSSVPTSILISAS